MKSNIHHPTDSSLLNDSVRVLTRLIGQAVKTFHLDIKFVDHQRRARKRALDILNAKSNKKRVKPYRDLVKVARWTVGCAEAIVQELKFISFVERTSKNEEATKAAEEIYHFISLAQKVISQTMRRVFQGESVPSSEKVVSIFEPHTDIIVKDRRETYYGHKIVVTGGESGLLTDLVVQEGVIPQTQYWPWI